MPERIVRQGAKLGRGELENLIHISLVMAHTVCLCRLDIEPSGLYAKLFGFMLRIGS